MNRDEAFEIIAMVVPNLEARMEQYAVDTSEVDDELLEIFMEQIALNIDGIEAALAREQMIDAANEAHSIKGMGGTAGFPELSVLAEELERAGRKREKALFRELYDAMVKWLKVCTA
ncbi:MAG: Hpt domain-containing protein [Spartobacteria bacterium]|nr:Hpt domain-containing protein [Spartobacteria bacterium]